MDAETIATGVIAAYVGGVVITGVVCAFGSEAFYWDSERAIETALLWPLILAFLTLASPFLLAGFLGTQWRRMADAQGARNKAGATEPFNSPGRPNQ